MHFQGLTVQTTAFGALPWYSASLISMDAAGELENVLDHLSAAGDTHVPIDWAWDYGEAGQPYGTGQIVPPRDLRNDPDTYRRIVDRVIQRGFVPMFVFSGEGTDGYNDLMANFEARVDALRVGYDRTAYGPCMVWYDGVWPAAWSVEMMQTFLPKARAILGDGAYLGMMFAGGAAENQYLVVTGIQDYAPSGLIYEHLDIMQCTGSVDQTQGEALGQIATRMLGPAFINNVVGYSGENYPVRTFYPSQGCKRGAFFWGWIEYNEYEWVRNRVSQADIDATRTRLEDCGVSVLG